MNSFPNLSVLKSIQMIAVYFTLPSPFIQINKVFGSIIRTFSNLKFLFLDKYLLIKFIIIVQSLSHVQLFATPWTGI